MVVLPFALALSSTEARASTGKLDPLNRLHVGLSASDGHTMGLSGGLDSRLTRLAYVDVGGFVSPLRFPSDASGGPLGIGTQDLYLRDAIYFSPGLRLPHDDGDGLTWDVLGRLGFGAVWMTNTEATISSAGGAFDVTTGPTTFGGVDLQVRSRNAVGVKISGKEFVTTAYSTTEKADVVLFKPQISAEVLYQW